MPDINPQNNNEETKYEVRTMADDLNEARSNPQAPAEAPIPMRVQESLKPSFIEEAPIPVPTPKPEINIPVPPVSLPIGEIEEEKIEKEEALASIKPLSPLPIETKREIPQRIPQQIIQPEELTPESLEPKFNAKKIITIGSVVFVIVVLGILAVYYIIPMFEPFEIPAPTTSEMPIPIVESILKLEMREEILLINNTTEELFNVLSALVAEPLTEGSMEELIITSESSGGQKLDLINIFETLNIAYPQELFFIMDSNYYEMFLYSAKNNTDLGFAMEIQNESADSLKEILSNWENTMMDSFKPFYYGRIKNPNSFNFQDSSYKVVGIRYINLNNPETTIDYAVYTDSVTNKTYWLFATSKNGMFAAIDRIVGVE